MHRSMNVVAQICVIALAAALATACRSAPSECGPAPASPAPGGPSPGDVINLSDTLSGGRIRRVNRNATPLAGGSAVRVAAAPGVGLLWIEGTDFASGTIDADVCGRDVYGESFVGIAFHRKNDETYEAVYLRPFNFRSGSPDRRQHAVQYIAMPGDDYARLRLRAPGEFEDRVDPAVAPTKWNRLRLVVGNGRVQAFVGDTSTAALDVRELQPESRGQVGLYVDNGSDGIFANLRIVKAPG